MPFNLGVPELVIILVILLIFVGPGKLPSLGGAIGKSIREFRKGAADETPDAPKASADQPS